MISPSSGGETEVETTIIATQKSNKITSFFAKLVSWSSRENVSAASKEAKQNKKKRLNFFKNKPPEGHEEVKSAQFNNKDLSEEFGVAETETLQHFAKPKPPRNRRRPRNTTKVAPLLSDLQEEPENHENDLEINRQVMRKSTSSLKSSQASKSKEKLNNEINENDIEEIDEKQTNQTENGEEVIVLRRNVMTELNRSLSSRLAGTKSLCQPTDVLKPKTNQNRPSDIFTQRLRSHNHNSQDGIENPTSL